MANVYKDKRTNTWYISTKVKIDDTFKSVKKRGYLTKGDAVNDYNRVIKEFIENNSVVYKAISFNDLIKEFHEDRLLDVKAQTERHNTFIIDKYFMPHFNGKSIKEVLNDTTVALWYKQLVKTQNISTDRKNRVVKCFKSILLFSYKHFYIDPTTFQKCDLLLKTIKSGFEIKQEKQVWTYEEYQRFLKAIPEDNKYYVLFSLFGELGCRIGELQGLQWKHINLDEKTIYICQQVIEGNGTGTWKIDTPKTATSVRYNHITDNLYYLLRTYKVIINPCDDDFVFFGDRPISRTQIRKNLHDYSKKAGVKYITPHGLRHSNTSWLIGNTSTIEDVKVVSKRLGHSSTKITLDTYSHILHDSEDNLLNKSFGLKSDSLQHNKTRNDA